MAQHDSAIDRLAVPAVRYALGRQTYVVKDVCSALSAHLASLSVASRETIIRDIDAAERVNHLGFSSEAQEWKVLRNSLHGLPF